MVGWLFLTCYSHRRRWQQLSIRNAERGCGLLYLAVVRTAHEIGRSKPGYVEREFRCYLECGTLAHGYARARCGEPGRDFLIAVSYKGRALCSSCNARRMAETAAHLIDHLFPPLPVRQQVLSVPKRLRYFLQHEPKAISAVPHILLRMIEARLVQCSGCARAGGWGR